MTRQRGALDELDVSSRPAALAPVQLVVRETVHLFQQ